MTKVTPAEPTHVDAIATLAEETDRFYGATDIESRADRIRQINQALFSDRPAGHALLAWDGDQAVGFAAYSFLWPAIGVTRSLYLKELYVSSSARRNGAGKLLMHSLYEVALEHGCSRVEWTTDQDNLDAQRFYGELGVRVNTSKLFYRLDTDQLLRDSQHSV